MGVTCVKYVMALSPDLAPSRDLRKFTSINLLTPARLQPR